METWTSTTKTILAAALGTLGVPIRLEKMLDERSGKGRRDFFLGPASTDGKYQTGSLKSAFEKGTLLREQTDHPITDIVYAKHSRDRILDAVNRGVRIQLVTQSGSRKTRTFYQHGGATSFPGTEGLKELFSTRDLNLVGALSRFGVPVLQVTGPAGKREFFLDARARLTSGEEMAAVVKKWREGEISSEHPFAFAMWGLINYGRLLREMNEETEQVLIRKPGSAKAAYVNPGTTGKGMDKVRSFFLG